MEATLCNSLSVGNDKIVETDMSNRICEGPSINTIVNSSMLKAISGGNNVQLYTVS